MKRRSLFHTPKQASQEPHKERGIALHYVVESTETFDHAAARLHYLIYSAQQNHPGKPRLLFVEIKGHRNPAGGFDDEMYALMKDFVLGKLGRYLTEICVPFGHFKAEDPQDNEVPRAMVIG